MKRFVTALLLATFATSAYAKTHKYEFKTPCSEVWPGVKDTLRNSGKYGILYMDNTEMSSSYNIGGFLTGRRTNSVLLVPQDGGCEMQIQTVFSGLENNDADDFKKRVDESLTKLPAAPANPAAPVEPAPVAATAPTKP